jgi:stage V sporulation protein G
MKITDVKIKKVETNNRLEAVASIVFDNEIAITGIKVIDGQYGLFVAMPNKKDEDGKFIDIAHPVNAKMRELITNTVLDAYNNL